MLVSDEHNCVECMKQNGEVPDEDAVLQKWPDDINPYVTNVLQLQPDAHFESINLFSDNTVTLKYKKADGSDIDICYAT